VNLNSDSDTICPPVKDPRCPINSRYTRNGDVTDPSFPYHNEATRETFALDALQVAFLEAARYREVASAPLAGAQDVQLLYKPLDQFGFLR